MSEATEVRVGKASVHDGLVFHPVEPKDSEDLIQPQWLLNGLGSYHIQTKRGEYDDEGNWVELEYYQYDVHGVTAYPGDIIWIDEDGKLYVKSS